ncbi:hypothetical protein ACOSQ2_025681 [Xanthoceras sorbifolium]|uniref:Uncharacterized protein n=1 Tax=Xanthoceras sorbifolium TaxID=99658 RepID=A0ABQ8H700_9ROSI|nr:hypothetical protein JRO89_XS13G0066300 [Xanthoceras sorbifolium]
MGLMDNFLHTEIARLVSFCSGDHPEGRSGIFPMENGHCSIKYKRRRVSAVRDFPPGCGRCASRINLSSNEEAVVDTVCPDAVKLVLSSNDVNGPNLMSTYPEGTLLPETDILTALEPIISDVANNLSEVDVGAPKEEMVLQETSLPPDWPNADLDVNSLEKGVTRNYPPRRMVSAVRDFPPFCGPNASCLGKEEGVKALTYSKSLGQEVSGTGNTSLGRTLITDLKQMADNVYDGDAYKSKLEGDISGINRSKVEAEFEGHDTMEMRKDDDYGTSSKNVIKVSQEDVRGKSIKSSHETKQYRFNCETGAVIRSSNQDDDYGTSSKNVIKVSQEDVREKSVKSSRETKQYRFNCETGAVIRSSNQDVGILEENPLRDIVIYTGKTQLDENCSLFSESNDQLDKQDSEGFESISSLIIVHGLMASPNCPWRQGKGGHKPKSAGYTVESNKKKHDLLPLRKSSQKSMNEAESSEGSLIKKNLSRTVKASQGMGQLVIRDKEDNYGCDEEGIGQLMIRDKGISLGQYREGISQSAIRDKDGVRKSFRMGQRSHNYNVSLPPSHPSHPSSGKGPDSNATGSRSKVRETLRLFQAVCRKLLQEEEAKLKEQSSSRRIDCLAARILKDKGKHVNVGKQIIGSVPGVEVGDEFQYRIELNIIGLHRPPQGGIDYIKQDGKIIATSIVASGGYDDDLDSSDVLTYTGQGGNVMNGGGKEPEDQKLERGNLALVNSKHARNPVRVIRGETKASDSARKYVYDGLYLVDKSWQEIGPHQKLVFKFKLVRIPGQPELAWKVVKKCKKSKVREGVCVDDISLGKELIPICAVNTLDDEKPPSFTYITGMMYPDWCHPIPPKGCDCIKGCSELGKCSCVAKNGGEIPYNHNGAIVEAKSLVYECGPYCKCPPSCYNRVTQHGIRFQLEIFKTESRGWGLRSLNSIPSGSFICEYVGELLEEKEADKRTGNDEYLFDIGNNYNDSSLWNGLLSLMPDAQSNSCGVVENVGFTIDAAKYGNVGRFINHSCSPNLYAQNVLFDHDDKRIPHIMLFAVENIPPLQELTYHYNYEVDKVYDSDGNIKKKNCYCGSSECTGRLY